MTEKSYYEQLLEEVKTHPPTDECPDPECYICGTRDCPKHEPLHYHHDGCPACTQEDRYGIRIVVVNWGCVKCEHSTRRLYPSFCLASDCTGSREEMKALLKKWKETSEDSMKNIRYDVVPYTGQDGSAPPFPQAVENPRNSRMK
jgi:hypothetical protein